jgi:hypothetical protein
MYWEDKPGSEGKRPAYLNLCFDTVVRHCGDDFDVRLLGKDSVREFMTPSALNLLDAIPSIPQKTDLIRLVLLREYGGVWLDADVIVFRSLLPYIAALRDYDYVGFGCYHDSCSRSMDGQGVPANWAMVSRRHGTLVTDACREAEDIVRKNPALLKKNYHSLGKDLLRKSILRIKKRDPSYSYYHVSSKCIERNHKGVKMTNSIMLSSAGIDPFCKGRFVFIPIYNTAPGFPRWFLEKSAYEVLYDDSMLISRLFRLSLLGAEEAETTEPPEPVIRRGRSLGDGDGDAHN